MRWILALAFIWVLLASPVLSQTAKTPAQLQAEIASTFVTGCKACITPAAVSSVLNDITASYFSNTPPNLTINATGSGSIPSGSSSSTTINAITRETFQPVIGPPTNYFAYNLVDIMNPGGTGNRNALGVFQDAFGGAISQFFTAVEMVAHAKSGTGKFTSSNPSVQVDSGVGTDAWAVGEEIDTIVNNGTSVFAKQGLRIVDGSNASGTTYNDGIAILNCNGCAGYTNAIHFTNDTGIDQLPVGATGTFIFSDSGTVATGVDFTNTTFNTAAFKSTGFSVDGSGKVISSTHQTTGTALNLQAANVAASVINLDFPSSVAGNTNQIRMFRGTTQASGSSFQIDKGDGTNTVQTNLAGNGDSFMQALAGKLTIGSGTQGPGLFNVAGSIGQNKITASGTAPGAGTMKFEVVAGTNAGTCKLIAYAGTSTTAVTIIDNVGSGC